MSLFRLCFLLFLLCVTHNFLQAQKRVFVRVYDTKGVNMGRGFLQSMTDSSLTLSMKKKRIVTIAVDDIGYLRLRRSMGHTIATSMTIFGLTGAAVGAISESKETDSFLDFTPLEGAQIGFFLGAGVGLLTGLTVGAIRKNPKFMINEKRENWLPVKRELDLRIQ